VDHYHHIISLLGDHYMSTTLQSVQSVSHNTKLFTFKLPAGSHMIVPMGYHVKIKADNELIRSYTPVLPLTGCSMEGRTISLLIKLYSDGRMSRYLSSLAVGKCSWWCEYAALQVIDAIQTRLGFFLYCVTIYQWIMLLLGFSRLDHYLHSPILLFSERLFGC